MTRDQALRRIKAHESELRQAGVSSLYLFGSTSRNEAGRASDVDLMCDLEDSDEIGLLEFIRIRDRLSDLLDSPIDLIERRGMRPRIRQRVEHEMVRVF
jgi:predicted nucleotidyltransferase|nr:nucleotidyltransferase domain-containing protein [Sphingomonas sp. Y57]